MTSFIHIITMSIKLILGSMFSGKSTALCQAIEKYRQIGKNVLVINHSSDTRYGSHYLCTHEGTQIPCLMRSELMSLEHLSEYKVAAAVVIDEIQFFDDSREFCSMAADRDGKDVVVAGLNGGYHRQEFPSVSLLLPLVSDIQYQTAFCTICRNGTPSCFTHRKHHDSPEIVIGGAELYEALCRQHYVEKTQSNGIVSKQINRQSLEAPMTSCSS